MDVLGRSATFDATSNSVVRVEAGLRDYYAGEGSAAEVRFEIPKGRYSPKIHLSTATLSPAATQQIRFLKSPDGTSLAYAVSGRGRPLVKAANWLSHLEFDHQSPVWLHWWRELSARYHLIRYDVRGCGLSAWDGEFSFDTWVEDLETVIDRTVEGRCALLGISQGAAVALAYAARHPERVSHLVLYGGYAQDWLIQFPAFIKSEQRETLQTEILGSTRERMVRELCEVLEIITAETPWMVALEDLHWVDPSTLDLISALARRRDPARLLLVGTYRPVLSQGPLKNLKQDLLVRGLCHELAIECLEESDAADYLARTFTPESIPFGFSALIHHNSGGNPLFNECDCTGYVEQGFNRGGSGKNDSVRAAR